MTPFPDASVEWPAHDLPVGCFNPNGLGRIAWFCANSSGVPHATRAKNANLWQLHDVSGNVAEWVWDAYQVNITGLTEDPSVDGAANANRVVRGGSFNSLPTACRLAERASHQPALRPSTTGVRFVRTVFPAGL